MDTRLAFLTKSADGNDDSLPISCAFDHLHDRAQGAAAMHYWPPKQGTKVAPEQLTLFIIGNPGLLDYYLTFVGQLRDLLPPSHAILCTSHIGHEPSVPAPQEPLNLAGQLEAKVELTKALLVSLQEWYDSAANESNGIETGSRVVPRLALMGHSVGAWLSCEVMKRVKEVHAGYLLFPTLGWLASTWNGRTLWPIFHRPFKPLLPLFAPLLNPILPLTTFPAPTVSLLRSPTTIRHVLALAKSEMLSITDLDTEWFNSQRPKSDDAVVDATSGLFGVWSAGNLDGWVGRDGPIVRECLGEDRSVLLDGVPHAFCLLTEHSHIVAGVVAGWILHHEVKITETNPPEPTVVAAATANRIPL